MVEGGQGSLVGLAPVHYNFYKSTHPKSYLVTKVCHEGDNLDRYLMGRQLMVVFIVFTVNISAGPLEGAEIWGLPEWVIDTFLGSGLAMILMTAMVGQLNSQVNASLCMLDYINNSFALFTFWVAMAIEFSGLLHSSYLIAIIVSMLAGKPIETKEEPRTTTQSIFFWSRVLVSLIPVTLLLSLFPCLLESQLRPRKSLCGRCDGYILEGEELNFYKRKLEKKKK